MSRSCARLVVLIAALVGSVLALPPLATAQNFAQGTLYEVLESPPAHAAPGGPQLPGTFPPGLGGRLAQGTEAGTVQGFGSLAFLGGAWQIHAQSRVPVDPATGAFGAGGVNGVFLIHGQQGGVVNGKLSGTLDLSGLPVPLAPTQGEWQTLGRDRRSGHFTGIFLLPFQIPGLAGWFYLDPATGFTTPTAVLPNEFNRRGEPLVKLLLTLTP